MKSIIISIGTVIAFVAGSSLITSCGPGSQKSSESAEQHDMESNHDGETMAAVFACPMHPEITGKEGDKCSKCGMDLVTSTDDHREIDGMKDMNMSAMASCPMHPDITGKEGEKCSKCGMALVLAEAGEEEQEHQH